MTLEELSKIILNRIYSVNQKNYSQKERDIRVEELNFILDYVDGFREKRIRRRIK